MKITVLLENSTPSDRYCAKHGLSMLIDAECGKVLFDMGPDGSFIDNARALGIDVTEVDAAVVSHGHFDHGGGLRAFLDATEAAGCKTPVYVHSRAFEAHRASTPAGLKDIGIDADLPASYPGRLTLTGDTCRIGGSLDLFAGVEMAELAPASNRVLLEQVGDGSFEPDSFAHEQSLLVREGGRTVLVSGCSHAGIVNVVRKAEEIVGGPIDAVVAGFHLMNPASGDVEDPATVAAVAEFLAARPTRYFTFHCTGLAAYGILRDALGERIGYLCTGSSVEL